MACRTMKDFHYAMWDVARIRIRGLCNLTKDFSSLNLGKRKIAEIFTSEKAIALIVRWHVNWPTQITGNYLIDVLTDAVAVTTYDGKTVNWSASPDKWDDTHEKILIEKLINKASQINKGVYTTFIQGLNDFNKDESLSTLGKIKTGRGTFKLY